MGCRPHRRKYGRVGLTLSPMDMAKIGQLFLNGGVWNGNRIVSEKWVSDSTSEQSRWKQRDLPYGYLWWIDEQDNGYAAMGDGGNIIYVSPDKNMVVASTSLFIREQRTGSNSLRSMLNRF